MSARFDGVLRDVRRAVRGFARRPLYALAVVLTLTICIGANTAVFSVVHGVLFQPFPVPSIDRLAVVNSDFPHFAALRNAPVGPPEAVDLFARRDLFSSSAASTNEETTVQLGAQSARAGGARTLGDFFTVFAGKPLYGRLYRADDSQPGHETVVILSHRFWLQISGDSTIVGRTVQIEGVSHQVIGVMSPDFGFPRGASYWRPFVLTPDWLTADSRGTLVSDFVGRMRDGIELPELRHQLQILSTQWGERYPDVSVGGKRLIAQSFLDVQSGAVRPAVLTLWVGAGLVLLIACANIAGLQLVRAAGQVRELALRAALGAGRATIARQLFVENALLALAGGVGGLLFGRLALQLFVRLSAGAFPGLASVRMNGAVVAFTAGIVVLSGLLFGTAPSLRAARTEVSDALGDSSRGSPRGVVRHRFLRVCVVAQIALTLLLLVGAGLTIRSLDKLLSVDPGFHSDGVVTFDVAPMESRYTSPAQRLLFFQALYERLQAIPGVQAVGFAWALPFTGVRLSTSYNLPGVPQLPNEQERHANFAVVYGDFFKAMGIQMVRGRSFSEQDVSGSPSVVVDATLVRQSFGERDPIGATIEHGPRKKTIIGVARPIKREALSEVEHPMVYHYFPEMQSVARMHAVVRSSLPAEQIVAAARVVLADVDPTVPLADPRTLDDRVSNSLGPRRLTSNVLSVFATVSFVLALLGIYAVVSYVVSGRTKELGIRMALGAKRSSIVILVLRDAALLASVGLSIGLIGFIGVGELMRPLLYGVSVNDPVALGFAATLLVVVTLVASYLPARRAVRVDAVQTLRAE